MLSHAQQQTFGGLIFVLSALLWSGPGLIAGETTRVSVDSFGFQSNEISLFPSVSSDGRFVAFLSAASNLVSNDTNKQSDIFIHDRLTNETSRVSVSSTGVQSNGYSHNLTLSADGRFVAYSSDATNLVPGDTNGKKDIFVHDTLTKQTSRISVNSGGIQGNQDSYLPSLSADGRFVAFVSLASNLVLDDTNLYADIFVHDRLTHTTRRVNVNSSGIQANKWSGNLDLGSLSLSSDGRFVAFFSDATNLVPRDTNKSTDVFVHDILTRETSRISLNSARVQGNSSSWNPSLSANARFIAFESHASNLILDDNNDTMDIFVRDRLTRKNSIVSVSSTGVQGNGPSFSSKLSANGRFVVFKSDASNLVAGDNNKRTDLFIHDRMTHKTLLVDINSAKVQANCESPWLLYSFPSLSADGRWVSFDSCASNLIEDDTNTTADIFVRDRLLDPNFQTDLEITVSQQPAVLTAGNTGNYLYTVTNHGPDLVGTLRLQHLISNGEVLSLTPSQGQCRRYASLSLCNRADLPAGASMTVQAGIKALRPGLRQQLNVSNNGRLDPNMADNYLSVVTPVNP